jgi:hypothetical protein
MQIQLLTTHIFRTLQQSVASTIFTKAIRHHPPISARQIAASTLFLDATMLGNTLFEVDH